MKFCMTIGTETASSAPQLLSGDCIGSMQIAKQLGYDGVEIFTPYPEKLDTDKINRTCEKLDMFIATLGTGMIYGKYGLHLMDGTEENQERLLGMLKYYIDIAQKIESKVTIGSIKGNVPKGANRERCLDILGKNLQAITAYAKEKEVVILLESTNHYENGALNTAKDTFEMIESYSLSNTEILLDSYHINIDERSFSACLKDAGRYLGHIHFADNTRTYPGSGLFHFDAFCQSIRDIQYEGVVSVECLPLPDGMTAAKQSMAFFNKHFR